MLDTLKFSAITVAAMVLSLIALAVGAVIFSGLAVAGAIAAIILHHRARTALRRQARPIVIEGEYYEVPLHHAHR